MSAPRVVVEAAPVELNAAEFELGWTALGLGEAPLVLELTPVGESLEEVSAAMGHARDTLVRRRLWDEEGPSRRLAALLRPLDRPTVELDVRVSGPGVRLRAVAASRDGDTVLAEHQQGRVTVTAVSEFSMPPAILSLLPDIAPGPGQVSAPTRELHRAIDQTGGDSYRLSQVLAQFGATQRDAGSLVQAMLSIHVVSKIGAGTRQDGGLRQRAESIVSLVDTCMGRYIVSESPSPDGASWTTWSPAEPRWVHTKLEELLV